MNISQHCFVPRGKNIDGMFYSLSGVSTISPSVSTTQKQIGDIYNSYQLYGNYMPLTGGFYTLRLFDRADGETTQGDNYVGSSPYQGYQYPLLSVGNSVSYTSSAFTFRNETYNGLPVVAVLWQEPVVSLGMLSLGNSLSPDVIDDDEEMI